MPVVIKYVVERNGVEKMTFSSKADADQYDKLLDTAESLEDLLNESGLLEDEQCTTKLAMYLAENKDDVLSALGNKRKKSAKKTVGKSASTSIDKTAPLLEDLVIEPDADSYFEEEDTRSEYTETDDLAGYEGNDVYSESDAA